MVVVFVGWLGHYGQSGQSVDGTIGVFGVRSSMGSSVYARLSSSNYHSHTREIYLDRGRIRDSRE